MSAHLTHEELTDAMSGASSPAVDAHLLICPRCAHELDQVQNSIAAFRGAALAWSESSGAADRAATVLGTPPRRPGRAGLWILAAATVLLAGGSRSTCAIIGSRIRLYLPRSPIR
jgi:anti-sigma factor RsiW